MAVRRSEVEWPANAFLDTVENVYTEISFWYGVDPLVIYKDWPNWLVRVYASAIARFRAQLEGVAISGASYPHMKSGQQASVRSRLKRTLRTPTAQTAERALPPGMFKTNVASLGIQMLSPEEAEKKRADRAARDRTDQQMLTS